MSRCCEAAPSTSRQGSTVVGGERAHYILRQRRSAIKAVHLGNRRGRSPSGAGRSDPAEPPCEPHGTTFRPVAGRCAWFKN